MTRLTDGKRDSAACHDEGRPDCCDGLKFGLGNKHERWVVGYFDFVALASASCLT
jgi:hypothetical protein